MRFKLPGHNWLRSKHIRKSKIHVQTLLKKGIGFLNWIGLSFPVSSPSSDIASVLGSEFWKDMPWSKPNPVFLKESCGWRRNRSEFSLRDFKLPYRIKHTSKLTFFWVLKSGAVRLLPSISSESCPKERWVSGFQFPPICPSNKKESKENVQDALMR